MNNNIAHRLEQYTIKQANQVLIVNIVIEILLEVIKKMLNHNPESSLSSS